MQEPVGEEMINSYPTVEVPENVKTFLSLMAIGEQPEKKDKKTYDEVIRWIAENWPHIGDLKRWLQEEFGASEKMYKQILKAVNRYIHTKNVGGQMEQEMEGVLIEQATRGAVDMAQGAYELARVLMQYWDFPLRMGYGDTLAERERFFKDAIEFYVQNHNLRQELREWKAIASMLAELSKPQRMKLAALYVIKSTVAKVIEERAKGAKFPPNYEKNLMSYLRRELEQLISKEVGEYT